MRTATRFVAAISASLAFAVPAQAQVTFTGFTNGCFFTATPCTPGAVSGNTTTSLGNLTYRTSTFSGTTSTIDGSLGLGEVVGDPNIGNLGSFTLANGNFDYNTGNFILRVTFTAPSGTSPNTQLFTADLMGSVTGSNGGVLIDFSNEPVNFTYDGGTFSLRVNDLSLIRSAGTGSSSAAPLTGFIQTSVVPEPSTYLLMTAGLAGLGLVARRKRTSA